LVIQVESIFPDDGVSARDAVQFAYLFRTKESWQDDESIPVVIANFDFI
jgi:hypothetical protein